jgi:hypothetical protein
MRTAASAGNSWQNDCAMKLSQFESVLAGVRTSTGRPGGDKTTRQATTFITEAPSISKCADSEYELVTHHYTLKLDPFSAMPRETIVSLKSPKAPIVLVLNQRKRNEARW